MLTHATPYTNHLNTERASSFTSKGSITIEAAVVIPMFFLAILCMVYCFEVIGIRTAIRYGMQSVGKELAEKVYYEPVLSIEELERDLVNVIGNERLEDSVIAQGSKGLHCTESKISLLTGEVQLVVQYQIQIPVPFFRLPVTTFEERLRVKGWTGQSKLVSLGSRDEIVYVTEYGTVYHKSLACSYLELSIRVVNKNAIATERNASGGMYYICERCENMGAGSVVYVTDYGSRYHMSLNCSGLKRTVYAVPLYELNELGGCSKCVWEM